MRHGCHDRRNESPRKTGKAASGSIRTALRTNRTSVERSPHTNRITAERKTTLTGHRGDKPHRSPTIQRSDRFRTPSSPAYPFRTGQPRSRPFRPSLILSAIGGTEAMNARLPGSIRARFGNPARPARVGRNSPASAPKKSGREKTGGDAASRIPSRRRIVGTEPLYIALIRATGATDMSANSPRWYLK